MGVLSFITNAKIPLIKRIIPPTISEVSASLKINFEIRATADAHIKNINDAKETILIFFIMFFSYNSWLKMLSLYNTI